MKKAVLLVTLGGPRTSGEIPDFIKRFTGKELPPQVMRAIIERYKLIGGYSPLCEITEKQSQLLQSELGDKYICLPAFRYAFPSISDSIDMALNSEADEILFFILSPFYTSVTTGNYINVAKEYLENLKLNVNLKFIHSWYKNENFISAWCNKIREETDNKDSFYIFSAHSLPEKFLNEPYKNQIVELTETIAKNLNLKNYKLGWQSIPSMAKEKWIEPTVENIIDEVKSLGFDEIIQVPIGFTADHIETLYDIDICHKEYAEKLNLKFKRISSLNTYPLFIKALADIVKSSQGEVNG